MTLSIISFYAAGVIGLVSALVVASSLNPVHRIAFQIQVFLSGSFLMILLDFYFLGLTYIIVYVGAIMILFLFVIMMVQIHLMPVTTSITPGILNTNLPRSLSALDETNMHHNLSDLTQLAINPTLDRQGLAHSINDHTLSLSTTHMGVNRIRKGVFSRLFSIYILQIPLLSQYIFTLINPAFWNNIIGTHYTGYSGGNMIVNYFFPSWFVEFKTMTDLETLANILYQGYPTAQLLVGVALWAVLIGIIKVTASKA